jgi:hypothetical protein
MGVVSLTIARCPLQRGSYAIEALLPTPLGGTPLALIIQTISLDASRAV